MYAKFEVVDKEEAELLRAGLADREVRVFVKIVGALSKLADHRARRRVLNFVADVFLAQPQDG